MTSLKKNGSRRNIGVALVDIEMRKGWSSQLWEIKQLRSWPVSASEHHIPN